MQAIHTRLPILVCAALLAAGCGSGTVTSVDPPGTDPPDPVQTVKGLAISPAGFPEDFSGLPAFLAEASSLPDAGIMWNGAWRQDVAGGSDAGLPPDAAVMTASLGPVHGFAPILVFGWRAGEEPHIRVPSNPINDWSNQEAAELFGDVVAAIAAQHAPPFLFLGNESDLYFDMHPADYQRWIAVYEAAYARIKEVSPDTRVGPIFQYERMAGIGALAGHTTPSWGALSAHDLSRVDIVGITLYPFFAHATPDAVPDDYLAPLAARIGDTPIAVTETGWPAERPDGFDPPWETSEAHQVAFIETLDRILAGRAVRLVNWVWLHPPAAPAGGGAGLTLLDWQIFYSLSLRRASGEERPVYAAWRDFTPNAR